MKHFDLQNCLIVSRPNFFEKFAAFYMDAGYSYQNRLLEMDTIMIQSRARMQEKLQEKIDLYSDMLFKIAYARLGNRADAEDVVQETFYQYLKAAREFENAEHEKAWLIRVTLNGCRREWRNAFNRRRSDVQDLEQLCQENTEAEGECSPEETVLCRERAGAVMEAVWKLPMRYRDVIHLFYYEDLSVNEIAEILGRKTSTVTSQLTRGREILKKSLKEEYDFA